VTLPGAETRGPNPVPRRAWQSPVPRRVWESAAWMVAGRLYGSACTVTLLWVAAQALDGPTFGRFAFWIVAFLVLDAAVDMGIGQVAVQQTASDPGNVGAVVRTARRVRLVTGLCGSALVTTYVFVAREPDAPWIALASLYPVTHALEVSTLAWRNAIRWRGPVMIRASAVTMSLGFVLVAHALGLDGAGPFLFAIALGSSLGNVLLHTFGARHLPPGPHTHAPLGPFLRAALPMGIGSLAQQLYFHVDNVFVRAFRGDEEVGHYNVAVRVMSLGISGAVLASSAALPWLTRAHAAGELRAAALRLVIPIGGMGLVFAALLWPLRGTLLGVFGAEFRAAEGALGWLAGALLAVHVGAPLLTAVVATGRLARVATIALVALALNVVLNSWLVPEYGMEGAAAATCATELCVALAAFLSLPARTGAVSLPREAAR
jgi:O-antigen/teichoic acid export membrane protein